MVDAGARGAGAVPERMGERRAGEGWRCIGTCVCWSQVDSTVPVVAFADGEEVLPQLMLDNEGRVGKDGIAGADVAVAEPG